MYRRPYLPLSLLLGLCLLLSLSSCSYFHRVPADLEQKLDSIRRLEEMERLHASGYKAPISNNPLQAFYDSLAIQPLPVRYTDDYVKYCQNFSYVPAPIARYLDLEGRDQTRAIALPQRGHIRLMMIAAFDNDGLTEMWLYSLDGNFFPKDKLCVYDIADDEENHFFSVTSDYEIYRDNVIYQIDPDGLIQEFIVADRPEDD